MASSLIATQAPESDHKVELHPLVLLTASDLITRHRLRQLEGPIAGILLGQQHGTTISAEYAFTAKIKDGLLDETDEWTSKRIAQYKEVHQKPVLEVVGWFTLCPEHGPSPQHALLHKQLTSQHAENGVMLAIHPNEFNAIDGAKAKLPVSVYESMGQTEQPRNESAMQVDGSEAVGLRFRPVPFVIMTDETEMIAINYVAKGAGGAGAIPQTSDSSLHKNKDAKSSSSKKEVADTKELAKPKGPVLTPEEEDQLAGLTTRLNAIIMLQERLQLMSKLVESVPPSYLSNQTLPLSQTIPDSEHLVQLRNIQALLTRLSLLTPASREESSNLQQASRAQANDVALTLVLSQLGQDVQGLSELGRKFVTVEQSRSQKNNKSKGAFGSGGFGSMDDFNGRSDSGLLMM